MIDGIPTLEDLGDVSGRRVLVRTDFNVPMETLPDGSRRITDDFRVRAALPTIEWLRERGASVVCASHLGRPKGKPEAKYSMKPVADRLAELAPGVELLENLRFDAGEEANTEEFVARLIDLVANPLASAPQPPAVQFCGAAPHAITDVVLERILEALVRDRTRRAHLPRFGRGAALLGEEPGGRHPFTRGVVLPVSHRRTDVAGLVRVRIPIRPGPSRRRRCRDRTRRPPPSRCAGRADR